MSHKKILFFTSVTHIGGAETNILKISHELANLGYEIHFATLVDNGPMFSKCSHYAASSTEIGMFTRTPAGSIARFKKLLEKDFDVVLNFGLKVEVFSRILTKIFSPKTKVIANIRTTDSFRSWKQVWIDRSTKFLVDLWISNSIAGKEAFVKREKVNPAGIKIIYNYIEDILPENSFPPKPIHNPVRIGILANIRKLKGYYDLIPLTELLLKMDIQPLFVCAGLDNTDGDFGDQIRTKKLEKYFEFSGFVEHKDEFLKHIDIFLLPSYMEGMPTSILEAMNYEVPIVSTNIDGIPEQIENGKNGFLVKPGDIEGFAQAIRTIIQDDQLRERFVRQSKKVLQEKFTKDVNLKLWVESLAPKYTY